MMREQDTGGQQIPLDQLQRINRIGWSTSWSGLPTGAERHAEQAFEHIVRAIEITEADDE